MQAISNAGYAGYEVMQILVGYEVCGRIHLPLKHPALLFPPRVICAPLVY